MCYRRDFRLQPVSHALFNVVVVDISPVGIRKRRKLEVVLLVCDTEIDRASQLPKKMLRRRHVSLGRFGHRSCKLPRLRATRRALAS